MITKRMLLIGSVVVASAAGYATPASAQATRTWVSGVGDDVNPCSRTAPCKTFAGAISKTATGGEIDCLDPGGFGTLTITKSITIDCSGTFGSVLASGTNGFTVNDINSGTPNTAKVILRGLTINGAGTTTGSIGINFVSGGSLILENSLIQNFNFSSAVGIKFSPGAAGTLTVNNSTIADSGLGSTGGGILIQPTGTGSAKVALDNVRMQNNANAAFKVDTTGNTGTGVMVSIDHSQLTGSGSGLASQTPSGSAPATIMLANSTVANNGFGIIVNGAASRVRVGNTTVTGNGTGVTIVGGAIVNSYGDNRLDGNTTDGAFTAPVIPKK